MASPTSPAASIAQTKVGDIPNSVYAMPIITGAVARKRGRKRTSESASMPEGRFRTPVANCLAVMSVPTCMSLNPSPVFTEGNTTEKISMNQ